MTTLELLNALTIVGDALPADDLINRQRLAQVAEDVLRRAGEEEDPREVGMVERCLTRLRLVRPGSCPTCGAEIGRSHVAPCIYVTTAPGAA